MNKIYYRIYILCVNMKNDQATTLQYLCPFIKYCYHILYRHFPLHLSYFSIDIFCISIERASYYSYKLHNFQIHSWFLCINKISRETYGNVIQHPWLFRGSRKFHGTFGFMKRPVVTYTKYPENRERCRMKSMGSHISVKSPGNPAICIYFLPKAFFRRRVTMKNSTRYPVFAAPWAGKKFFSPSCQDLLPSVAIDLAHL